MFREKIITIIYAIVICEVIINLLTWVELRIKRREIFMQRELKWMKNQEETKSLCKFGWSY